MFVIHLLFKSYFLSPLESHNAQKFIEDSEKSCSKENYLHYLTSSIS